MGVTLNSAKFLGKEISAKGRGQGTSQRKKSANKYLTGSLRAVFGFVCSFKGGGRRREYHDRLMWFLNPVLKVSKVCKEI